MAIFSVTVTDIDTAAPISGANVFINAVLQGQTNGVGQLNANLSFSGDLVLSVTASGYQSAQQIDIPIDASGFAVQLTASVTQTSTLFLQVYPETPLAGNTPVGQTFTISNGNTSTNFTYTVGGISIPGLINGPAIITGTIPGYLAVSNTTTISGLSNSYTIVLTEATDFGLARATSPQLTPGINTTVNTLPALTSPTNSEFVPPNTDQGTYFTMTQARLYIGRVFIDELNGIQFTLQNNKIPIYGYASRDFDAVAQGKALVQGQFTINFISEGYLYVVLQDYIKNGSAGISLPTVQDNSQKQLNSLVAKLQNPDPQWTPEMIANATNNINAYITGMGPDALSKAKSAAKTAQNANNNSILGLAGGDYPNAVYQNIGFDVVLTFSGAGRTVTRRLESCWLISNESILDHSGTPILDSYGFIARKLR